MSHLAADWSHWSSDCAARPATQRPARPAGLTLTATIHGRQSMLLRIDVATGEVREGATVLPFRRPDARG